jgi:hypothetical protein
MRRITTFFLLVVSEKLCSTDAGDNTCSQVFTTVGACITAVFANLFPNIDHAIIATVVVSTSLRDGIMWAYRSSSAASSVVIVVITRVIKTFSDLLFIEEVFFSTRWIFVSAANNTSFVFDILFSNNLIVIVSDPFSDYDGFLTNNNRLWWWWRTEVLGTARVSLKISVSIVEHASGRDHFILITITSNFANPYVATTVVIP